MAKAKVTVEVDGAVYKLADYEVDIILEALRRDARNEKDRVYTDPQWSDLHRMNSGHDTQMLQLLSPKHASALHVIPHRMLNSSEYTTKKVFQ